ncbi:DnaJ domain-containing protein [Spinellus fusiger]|nr:DnaJ domain-containing protein [Spinellus fusiger]
MGNKCFQHGQFQQAESFYTRALESLPIHHDYRILLSNNRAAARLKTGHYEGSLSDCNVAIEMAERKGEGHCLSHQKQVSWQEQVVKALLRKTEALEALHKYTEAIQVYETIVAYQGHSTARIQQGMAQCQAALSAHTNATTTSTDFPNIDYSIFEDITAAPVSQGVAAMREREAKNAADGFERLVKADQVEAQLAAWKTSRQNNLQALLATLDTVVWPDLGWQKVGLADLMEAKQCKLYYRKAIAKVHPDKLSVQASVEQRMLAHGIFTTLNEAWDSYKNQPSL